MKYILPFLGALVVSAGTIPLIIIVSRKLHLFDRIDARKIHNGNISRLGGLAIFAGFIIIFAGLAAVGHIQFCCSLNIYLASLFCAFLSGFIDDFRHIRIRYKLSIQVLAASLAVYSGLSIEIIDVLGFFTLDLGILSPVLSVMWIILFMNVINLMDGMDGLAGGVSAIALLFIAGAAYMKGNSTAVSISLVLAGSVTGFLIFNFPPAKIFMGDGGAYFLGFLFGTIPLMGVSKTSTVALFIFPLALLSLHILDILSVIFIRSRNGRNIFEADNSHLHHRLLLLGLPVRGILSLCYGFTFIFGLFSLMLPVIPRHYAIWIYCIIFSISGMTFFILHIMEDITGNIRNRTLNIQEILNVTMQYDSEIDIQ